MKINEFYGDTDKSGIQGLFGKYGGAVNAFSRAVGVGDLGGVADPAKPQQAAAPATDDKSKKPDKAQVDLNVDKTVRAVRAIQNQPPGTKPVPTDSLAELTKDMPNVKLNKDYAIKVGQKILQLNQLKVNVHKLAQQYLGQYALGMREKTIAESVRYQKLNKIFENVIKNMDHA